MQLKTYLAQWKSVLANGSEDPAMNRYFEFVQHHYQSALKKMYRRFSDKLAIDWVKVAKQYYQIYPPESYELNRLTFAFPEFVQDFSEQYGWPVWAFDLAQYELAEFTVFTDPCKNLLTDHLQINPTLLLLEFHYDIANWVVALDQAQDELIQAKSHILAISRNPQTHLCQFTQVSPEILQILQELDSQLPLSHINPTIKFMQQQSILI